MGEDLLKVLLVDDHPLILTGLRRGLERTEDIEVVGEAGSAAEMMALIERRRPDIVLLDLRLPDVEGTEHIEQLRRQWPDIKVVVLSGSEDAPSVDSAVNAGASAFLVKSIAASDVAAILHQVAAGVFVGPRRAVDAAGEEPEHLALTDREQAILTAAARGLTTAQISQELWISEHTVKFHLTNVYRKLGVVNRAGAVRWALENGLGAG